MQAEQERQLAAICSRGQPEGCDPEEQGPGEDGDSEFDAVMATMSPATARTQSRVTAGTADFAPRQLAADLATLPAAASSQPQQAAAAASSPVPARQPQQAAAAPPPWQASPWGQQQQQQAAAAPPPWQASPWGQQQQQQQQQAAAAPPPWQASPWGQQQQQHRAASSGTAHHLTPPGVPPLHPNPFPFRLPFPPFQAAPVHDGGLRRRALRAKGGTMAWGTASLLG